MPYITKAATLYCNCLSCSPVGRAVEALQRDFEEILGSPLRVADSEAENQIRIVLRERTDVSSAKAVPAEEGFTLCTDSGASVILITARDELGAVFGIYHVCEHFLGVDPYWFWTDFRYPRLERIAIEDGEIVFSQSVRFRGCFINDEDCLTAWDDSITIIPALWERIFETLLRAGYNTVIPGTSAAGDASQLDIAAQFGLWIAQHHAEPLGAEMFADAYQGRTALIPEELDRFTALYRKAVQKNRHRKTLWTLGFRGQGDRSFFADDPRYDTPGKRGKLIGDMMCLQKKLVLEMTGRPQHFVHYLYGESMELYRDGFLSLDDDVIRVYADNGFGAMRVRRELCEGERNISSLPGSGETAGATGVYYHISFHDLHISNKLVPLVKPELIAENLSPFLSSERFTLILCNVSNIRPHVFEMELISKLLKAGSAGGKAESPDERPASGCERRYRELVDRHYGEWTAKHFAGFEKQAAWLLRCYFDAPFRFNPKFPDAKAGEEVYHHGLRRMIESLITGGDARGWFAYLPESFDSNRSCFLRLLELAGGSLESWKKLHEESLRLSAAMPEKMRRFCLDNLGMHIAYMYHSCSGFCLGAEAALAFQAGDYKQAFRKFSAAKRDMRAALDSLKRGEHGKWKNFYRGDWMNGTRETIRSLIMIIGVSKLLGDKLICNSSWMIEALKLKHNAIGILPQASLSHDALAKAFDLAEAEPDLTDLSALRNDSV